MVLAVSATEYLGRSESGRSKPMRCRCEDANGNEYSVYVKYSDFHEELTKPHLTAELIGNCLARDLDIPAAQPCIVSVSKEFIDTIEYDEATFEIHQAFSNPTSFAFGSVAIEPIRRWSETSLLHRGQLEVATKLYLFDTLTENSDRCRANPNLLVSGHDFHAIDFGHCFQRSCHELAPMEGAKPWENGGILNHYAGSLQHVFFEAISSSGSDHIDDFISLFANLRSETIDNYVRMIPEDWGAAAARSVHAYLVEARDCIQDFGDQVRGVLR